MKTFKTGNTDNEIEGVDYEVVNPGPEFKASVMAQRVQGSVNKTTWHGIHSLCMKAMPTMDGKAGNLRDLKELMMFCDAAYELALKGEIEVIEHIGIKDPQIHVETDEEYARRVSKINMRNMENE